ncbi:hypothetical protein ASPWEDRAFT_267935 [Aspergillus wentii DTO 134E9]|uniref:Transmembrane protein n=1 Tax=Aspergillus wentii DTO 134E9 TaxID=1073089 RepID=A0A1L9S2S0_ASPWE|nr:uncharacterized protein ASPWEDRAFT_267935 [Aspergillus wentii DTO 134E9]OJJ41437.1 hypothetical protein ASPWEDRAFT_267935 [Aspergillus wentii DTO 134E9]
MAGAVVSEGGEERRCIHLAYPRWSCHILYGRERVVKSVGWFSFFYLFLFGVFCILYHLFYFIFFFSRLLDLV